LGYDNSQQQINIASLFDCVTITVSVSEKLSTATGVGLLNEKNRDFTFFNRYLHEHLIQLSQSQRNFLHQYLALPCP